ncbi:hypothetical protein SDC9_150460 [bioreactor metagenome]|uniref:Uncharacterized protein n=1 Tax=bioreactor metagenome TaxID=1076179 RepID=A0A645ERT1_9ZZZZ
MSSPVVPVPGTVTPIPFFIKFPETLASIRSTGFPNLEAATAAAKASENGSVHPSAGTTSFLTALIKVSQRGFIVDTSFIMDRPFINASM